MESTEESEGGEDDMSPLDGSDEEVSSSDEKVTDGGSVIVTPGPREASDSDDRVFIKPDHEPESSPNQRGSDGDYVPSGTDADAESEDTREGPLDGVGIGHGQTFRTGRGPKTGDSKQQQIRP